MPLIDVQTIDVQMMSRALQLARLSIYSSRPNPAIGCVLVRDGRVIGEGRTQESGGNHAEIEALNNTGDGRGATAYVTLEPCSHHGKTGPCADALIAAGISRCFVAMGDPNPEVAGEGVAKLMSAGIEVLEGLLAQQAESINAGFFQRMRTGKPKIRIKLAASLDGRTAMANGESQWITGSAARADVQQLRAQSDALVTGVGTVLNDDPAMTVRDESYDIRQQPWRVVADSQLRTPPKAQILSVDGRALIAHAVAQPASYDNAELAYLPGGAECVDLTALVQLLAERQCNDILVECGPRLAGAFVEADLADELILYQAPILLGSQAKPMLEIDLQRMADKQQLRLIDTRRIGDDTRLILDISKD